MRRRDAPFEIVRRAAPAAVIAAAIFAPSASAGPVEDLTAVAQDYVADGVITPCHFTRAQLQSARSQIGPDILAYAPDLGDAVDVEIARWTSGGCSTGGGGSGGGPGGGSNGSSNGSAGGGGNGGQQVSYRASIKSLKVAKNHGSVKVKLRCPAAAIAGCHVILSGRLAGRSAAKHTSTDVARGASRTVKLKLKAATRQRLTNDGGKLEISAKTVGSTLAPASRSITIAP